MRPRVEQGVVLGGRCGWSEHAGGRSRRGGVVQDGAPLGSPRWGTRPAKLATNQRRRDEVPGPVS